MWRHISSMKNQNFSKNYTLGTFKRVFNGEWCWSYITLLWRVKIRLIDIVLIYSKYDLDLSQYDRNCLKNTKITFDVCLLVSGQKVYILNWKCIQNYSKTYEQQCMCHPRQVKDNTMQQLCFVFDEEKKTSVWCATSGNY